MKKCKKCGYQGKKGEFCPDCGAALIEVVDGETGEVVVTNDTRKSRVAAGLLGIFLGGFGVHNFYLGYTGKAIAQLLITVLSCGILYIPSWIWGLIEGILILTGSTITTDANGVPLKE